jgi:hypothetical protein
LKEELEESEVVAKFATTTRHGAIEGKTQTHLTEYYNLDMIISIGYRVNSKKATDFRIWATDVLKRYAVTGVAVNSEKLARLPSGEAEKRLAEIEGAMDLVKRLVANSELSLSETNGVL